MYSTKLCRKYIFNKSPERISFQVFDAKLIIQTRHAISIKIISRVTYVENKPLCLINEFFRQVSFEILMIDH